MKQYRVIEVMIGVACVGLLFAVTGRDGRTQKTHDQCLRVQLFQQCLDRLPYGPQLAQYGNLGEAVRQCESAADWQSWRALDNVKPECR